MDKGTQTRIVLFVLTWVNTWLVNKGLPHVSFLYINDETAALVLTFVISSWTTWKNNYITWRGQRQKRALERAGLIEKKE